MVNFLRTSSFSPLVVVAVCLAVTYLLGAAKWKLPWRSLSLALLITLFAFAAAYLLLPVLAEDTETEIASIASLAMRGLAVYPAPDAAARYILLYGPLTYLSHIPFYAAFGATPFSFKLLGILSFVATVTGLYKICRAFAQPGSALVGCGCAGIVLLRFVPVPFWGRIDSLILGIVVISLWIAIRAPAPAVLLSTVLATGILPNLKFTAAVYLLPLFAFLWMRRGPRLTISAAFLGILLLPLPFLLPEVSFSNYLFVIQVNARHGLEIKILLRNLQYTAILLAPVLLLYFKRETPAAPTGTQQKLLAIVLAASMAVSSIFGAKAGAGSYHLLPYIAPLLALYFWIRASASLSQTPDRPFSYFAVAWILAMLVFSAPQFRTFLDCLRYAAEGARATAQIEATEKQYRGRVVEVGVGDDFLDRRTLYGFIPVLSGQPYTISGSAIRDLQFGNVKIPQSTLRYLEQCGTSVWLIPGGQAPFTALNTYYSQPHPAFDEVFRDAFLNNYRRAATGPQFDTWVCKH